MKKLLYVTHSKIEPASGIWKKLCAQVNALKNLGFEVDFAYLSEEDNVLLDFHDGTKKSIHLSKNKVKKFFFYKKLAEYVSFYDVAYIRKPLGGLYSLFLISLLKALKKKNKDINIYYEIPTYPYKQELNSMKARIYDWIYDVAFVFFKKYLTEILIIGASVNNIHGIKTRNIVNGIEINHFELIPEKAQNGSEFVILGVANLAYWHGYDRIIDAIWRYDGMKKIVFNIVGTGEPEHSKLKNLVQKHHLQENVRFLGLRHSIELLPEYEKADVCLDALGRHRSGNIYNSSIKSKEYTAQGLPFVMGHIDPAFDSKEEFIYYITPNEDAINLHSIIDWRSALPKGFSIKEREYAKRHLTWESQLQFIKEANN